MISYDDHQSSRKYFFKHEFIERNYLRFQGVEVKKYKYIGWKLPILCPCWHIVQQNEQLQRSQKVITPWDSNKKNNVSCQIIIWVIYQIFLIKINSDDSENYYHITMIL